MRARRVAEFSGLRSALAAACTFAAIGWATPEAIASVPVDGLYCGTAMSGGRLVEVRTRLETLPDGSLSGVYEFADNGETTPGTLSEALKQAEPGLSRTLVWVDKYGTGEVVMNFDEKASQFDGKWGVYPQTPVYRWDGKRCSPEIS